MKQLEGQTDRIADWNLKALIVIALLLIVFLLAYIASK